MRTLLPLVALALLPAAAHANFHVMKIREVYAGSDADPGVQYVMLQMYAIGQNKVKDHAVTIFDAAGLSPQVFTFAVDVSNGANQAFILVGTAGVTTEFGVTPDLVMGSAVLSRAGGKACFDAIPTDCVAWGAYTGSATGVGTPVAPGGIPSGMAIRRDISAGNPSLLEGPDDTDVSSADFDLVTPDPHSNPASGPTTTTLPGGTTTTTTPGGGTTTTTLACPVAGIEGAQCVLAAVPPAACTGEAMPGKLSRTIAKAGTLLDRAASAQGTKRGRRLTKKAGARLKKARRMAAKAGRKGKLGADCSATLQGLLDDARARALGTLVS